MGCEERLAAQNPAARESHLALAEAALAAELWGEARRHLDRALAAEPPPAAALPANAGASPRELPLLGRSDNASRATPRICLMMARVADAEHQDPPRIREWLDRAVHALPDPRYVCANCGGDSAGWQSLCPLCGAFDMLAWRTPAWKSSTAETLVTIEAAAEASPAALAASPAAGADLPAVAAPVPSAAEHPG